MAFPTFHYPLLAVVFGVLGNIVSVMVYLAPVPTFYRIWRKKSTEGFKSLPYLVALFSSLLWLYYALLKGNVKLLITINSFGCIVETVYIIMFLTYAAADNKKSTLRLLVGMTGAFSLAILITHYSVTIKELRVKVFGWICVTVSVAVFVAPLSIAARVLKTKSVEFMPFSLSFFLTLSAIMWFFYGFFRNDICIMIPNTIGFALGISQMSLYALYRNANKLIIDEKLPEQVREIVMVSTLGAREVHPKSVVDIIPPVPADESGGGNPSKHDGTVQKNCNTPPV